jgi:delta(3,5)-delta(2,4)-dienoyl-CoA isomerase
MASSAALSSKYKFETLSVSTPKDYVYHVQLNRPQQFNAMNSAFWRYVLVQNSHFIIINYLLV